MGPNEKPDTDPLKPEEEMLCPHCLRPTDPISHFCNHCAGPTSMHASIDPLGQVYSAGHTYRNCTEKPTRFITVLGLWLVLGPQIFALIFIALAIPWMWVRQENSIVINGALGILISLGMCFLYGLVLYKTTRSYQKYKRSDGEDHAL